MANLVDFLKLNANTRKIFGKREIKIIEKQFLGINLTQSEKNRLSRDIRKKFEFIKDASKFSEEFELKKSQHITNIIGETKEIILEDFLFNKIKKMIVYGSFTENKMSFDSDIDIAVEFSNIEPKEAGLFRKRILGKINSKVDIQVYNLLPDKIKREINLKGRVLYKR